MPATPPSPAKRRLLRLLRRAAREAHSTTAEHPMPIADESALWSAHERALVRARDAGGAAQRIAATAGRQRSTMDSVAERTRAVGARIADVQSATARILDTFERLGLVALNAGLEGARLGEAEGRQLALVGEEIRGQAARGGDAGRDLTSHIAQLAADLGQLEMHVAQAQAVVAEVTQEAARAAGAASDTEAALADTGDRIKRATGSDPEVIRALAEVGERTRALVSSLASLDGKVPRGLVLGVLRPVVEPLEGLLGDGESGDGDSVEG
jgi:methyl-accepting chemotaxis protein